jgi:hypothetical protein
MFQVTPAPISITLNIKVDGWAKDRDPNTAYSETVAPLLFHAISGYPYPSGEHFLRDEVHQRFQGEYNTLPALRLLRADGRNSSGRINEIPRNRAIALFAEPVVRASGRSDVPKLT